MPQRSAFGLHEWSIRDEEHLKEMNRVLKRDEAYLVDYRIQNTAMKRLLFRIYLLCTSLHMSKLLRYDWNAIMRECGFTLMRSSRTEYRRSLRFALPAARHQKP